MPDTTLKAERKRGAPKGNQNARKHGFYSKVLDEAEQLDFELATGVEGIDDEIALLRVKIKSILENDPENIKLIMQFCVFARMLLQCGGDGARTRNLLSDNQPLSQLSYSPTLGLYY